MNNNLQNKKALVVDLITAEINKYLKTEIVTSLPHLINLSLYN